MKKALIALLLLLAAGCAGNTGPAVSPASESASPSSSAPANGRLEGKVTRIIDGDTVEVTIGDRKETVRMLLVDTPEIKKPGTDVQPFGPEASAFTKETLEGNQVTLERDVSERDQYGRALYYIWIGDKMFNELLLEKGLARVAVFPPDVKYVERFRELQKKAEEEAAGIWSIENYATDKGYDPTKSTARPTPSPIPSFKNAKTPAPATIKPAEAPLAPSAPKSEVYYKNCTEAKAAGVYNIQKGEPGYRAALDRDNDGVACEK
jgi:micrococcal nuclease